jgi:hypothetical protein
VEDNPPLERTAAAVYSPYGRASRVPLKASPEKQTRRHTRGELAYRGEWAYEFAGPAG